MHGARRSVRGSFLPVNTCHRWTQTVTENNPKTYDTPTVVVGRLDTSQISPMILHAMRRLGMVCE